MQITGALLAFFLLAACRASTSPPDLFQSSEFSRTFEDRARIELAAPVIVIGRIEGFRTVGVSRPAHEDDHILLEPMEVAIQVEHVLKGAPSGDRLNFFFYAYASNNRRDFGIRKFTPIPGQRRIFFLSRLGNGYRAVGDIVNYNILIESGYHSPTLCKDESVGCCIAKLLLTPGKGYDPINFRMQLAGEVSSASVFCSRTYSLGLVQELTQSVDPQIGRAANEIMNAAKSQ
jgi:hypothetical protein